MKNVNKTKYLPLTSPKYLRYFPTHTWCRLRHSTPTRIRREPLKPTDYLRCASISIAFRCPSTLLARPLGRWPANPSSWSRELKIEFEGKESANDVKCVKNKRAMIKFYNSIINLQSSNKVRTFRKEIANRIIEALSRCSTSSDFIGKQLERSLKISDSFERRQRAASRDFSLRFSLFLRNRTKNKKSWDHRYR